MNLRRIRKLRRLTQEDLAAMIEVDPATIQRAETMHKSAKLETYQKIAAKLQITIADIFCDDLTPVERELVRAFRSVPEGNRGVFEELVKLARGPEGSSGQ